MSKGRIIFGVTLLAVLISTTALAGNKASTGKQGDIANPESTMYAGVSRILHEEVEQESTEVVESTADPLNSTYPFNQMSADWGADVYDDGFIYYDIPKSYKDAGGKFPEVVQVYLWEMCKQKNLNYYLVVALIERESGYKYDCTGDDGNSLGYMQIYEKCHSNLMKTEKCTDLYDPYGNIRVGTSFLAGIFKKYGSSGDNCVLMVYNMGAGGANNLWKKGIYSSEYSREILKRSKEIEKEIKQDR